jgi:uncharacterized protein YjbI with pentapeptide repeats
MQRLLLALALALGPAAAALACTCRHESTDAHLASASLIFRGTVTAIDSGGQPFTGGPGTGSFTVTGTPQHAMRARFKVDATYKGAAGDEVEVGYTASDGRNCGWRFQAGQVATVFATGNPAKGYTTSMCMMVASAPDMQRVVEEHAAQRRRLHEAAQSSPVQPAALRELAAFHEKYKDLDLAEAAYTRWHEASRRDATALVGRARVRYAMERYDDALADYRAAATLAPNDTEARRGSALSLLKLGRIGEVRPDERDFTGLQSGHGKPLSFAGADLRKAIFRNAQLNRADFSNADLRGADFSGANFHTVNFDGARLDGATFANLKNGYMTTFRRASLVRANFNAASLFHANLEQATLTGADFTNAKIESTSLEGADLDKATFKGATLQHAKLRATRWNGQDLSTVLLSGSDLRDASLVGARLQAANFGRPGTSLGFSYRVADLRGADLSGADTKGALWDAALVDCRTKLPAQESIAALPVLPLWSGCPGDPPATASLAASAFQRGPRLESIEAPKSKLAGRQLAGWGFWRSNFDGTDFSRANLAEADIQSGSYNGARFNHANLAKAWLMGASMRDASFENADLSGVRFRGADLAGARFDGAKFDGACTDEKTVWPAAVDPAALGIARCR